MAKNNGRRLFVFLMAVFLFHFRPTFLLFFIGPKIKMKTSDKKEESRKHRHRLTWRRKQLFYFWFCFYFLDSSFAGADFSTAVVILFSYAGGYIIAAFLFLFFLFPPAHSLLHFWPTEKEKENYGAAKIMKAANP